MTLLLRYINVVQSLASLIIVRMSNRAVYWHYFSSIISQTMLKKSFALCNISDENGGDFGTIDVLDGDGSSIFRRVTAEGKVTVDGVEYSIGSLQHTVS